MRKVNDPRKARKRKLHWLIFFEIVFMAIGVACVLLPLRWRIVTLIVLGAREILLKAHTRLKQADKLEGEVRIDYGKEEKKREKRRSGEKQTENQTAAGKRGKQKLDGGETLRGRSK